MPAVAAAAGAVVGWVTTAWAAAGAAIVGTGALATTAWAALGKAVFWLAASYAVSAAQRAFSPKPKQSAGTIDQGQELQIKFDPAYAREVLAGRAATGGSLVYATVTGANNEFLWRVVDLSDVQIDAIEEIWSDNQKLTFSGDWHTGYATCVSHFRGTSGAPRLWVRIYKGTPDQTVDPDLNAARPTEWTAACRGRGVAYAIIKKLYDEAAYAGGEPSLFFVGRGALVNDPRTGLSAWSDNVALVAGQALRGFYNNGVRMCGLGARTTDIPEAEMIDAAAECDELRVIPGGTEKAYRCGGTIGATESAQEILTNLTAAMSGLHVDRGGEIVFLPGVARTPVLHFDEDDLSSDEGCSYTGRHTANDLANQITSTFVDPTEGWQEGALPTRKDADAVAEDNGEVFPTDRAYRYCISKTQGQRLDEIELRAARKMGRFVCSAPLWAFELSPGDWVTANSPRWGGATKTFYVETQDLRIVGGPEQPEARCRLSLVETDAGVYSDPTYSTNDQAVVIRPLANTWPSALGLVAGGTVAQETGGSIGAAKRPVVADVSDGEVLSWGPYDVIPLLTFNTAALPALAAGQYYDLRVLNSTTAGGTVYAKVVSGGSGPVSQIGETRSQVQSNPGIYEIQKPTAVDSTNGQYVFGCEVSLYGILNEGNGQITGFVELTAYCRTTAGGAWQTVETTRFYASRAGAETRNLLFGAMDVPAIGQLSDAEFRIALTARSNVSANLLDVYMVRYSTMSGGTAAAVPQPVSLRVDPK